MHYSNIREDVDEDGNQVLIAFCEREGKDVTFHPAPGNTMTFVGSVPEEVDAEGHLAMFVKDGMMMPRRGIPEASLDKIHGKLKEISNRIQEIQHRDRFIHVLEDGTIEQYEYEHDGKEYVKFYFYDEENGFYNEPGCHRLKIDGMHIEEHGYEDFDAEEVARVGKKQGAGFIRLLRCEGNCVLWIGKMGRDEDGALDFVSE